MHEYRIDNITYFLNDEKVEYSIVYDSERIINWDSLPRIEEEYEFLKDLWLIDGFDTDDTEGLLRELWKNGGVPFAYNNEYWKGNTIIHFAYPYWDYESDTNKTELKRLTRIILHNIETYHKDHYLWDRLEKYIEYERFFMNHPGTLSELFRDFYNKYIVPDISCHCYDMYYALYYYLVRLGYWWADYSIDLTTKGEYCISIDDDVLYLDKNIHPTKRNTLKKFFCLHDGIGTKYIS